MILTVMCGIPNSGKTTLTRQLSDEINAMVFRFDDYARGVKTYSDFTRILDEVLSDIRIELSNGNNAIYDTVNPDAASRKQILDYFSDMDDVEIVCAYVATSAEICIARDKAGWSAVFAQRFEPPTDEEGFSRIDVYHNEIPIPEQQPTDSERIANLETAVEELQIIDAGAREIMDILEGNAE